MGQRRRRVPAMWHHVLPESMRRPACIYLSLFVVAAACGGGSADSPAVSPATPAPTISATAAEALTFARIGMRGTFDVPDILHISAGFLRLPLPAAPTPPPTSSPFVGSAEVSGPDGGSATYTWQDSQLDQRVSTGDVFTITFSDYVDGGLTLSGVVVIDSLSTLGVLTQGGGTWIADATLRPLSLEYRIGSATFSMDSEFGVRLESRELLEIFEVALFEDTFVGVDELKAGSLWRRYETDDELSYDSSGAAYSPVLDGVVSFQTNSVVFLNTFTRKPVSGIVSVYGAGPTYVEVETQQPLGLGCTLPFPGFTCPVDLRVEEDGEAGFEATSSVAFADFLPQ